MKKFLSLVLALVMTMSLVTISAGAKDFADDDAITYDEAVAVLSEIGVVDGYTDGSFKPGTALNRGQAAKIICNLILGPTTAAELSADTAPFSDVPVDHTFAGYIAFCVKEGITSGYADGTYKPAAPLTSYAFMKMLLGALGYDAETEGYVGGNWSINVAKRALAIGLTKGLQGDFNGIDTVVREEAALYAFNTLKATMVEYDSKTTVVVGDATVALSGNIKEVNWGEAKTKNDGNIKADGYVQFAEKYFEDLEVEIVDGAYGRPANKWTNDRDAIGTFTSIAPDYVFTAGTKEDEVYDIMGKKYTVKEGADWTCWEDGQALRTDFTDYEKTDDDNDWAATADGAVTEVYITGEVESKDGDYYEVTIVKINYYLGEVVRVKSDKDGEYITVKPLSDTEYTIADKKFYVEGYEEDDLIVFTVDTNDDDKIAIASVEAPETVTGEVARVQKTEGDSSTYLRVEGEKYTYSAWTVHDLDETEPCHPDLNEEYNLYLDPNGFVLGFELAGEEADPQYLYVKDSWKEYGEWSAKVLLADGTVVRVDVGEEYEDLNGDEIDITWKPSDAAQDSEGESVIDGLIWAYSVDEDGVYTLEEVENDYYPTEKATIENDEAYVYFDENSKTKYFIVDEDTVFVDEEGETSYVGYSAVPNIDEAVIAYVLDEKVAEIVFVTEGEIYDKDSVYFVIDDVADFETLKHDDDYYRIAFDAYINGESVDELIIEKDEYAKVKTIMANDTFTLYEIVKTVDEEYITKIDATNYELQDVAQVATKAFYLDGTDKADDKYTVNDETEFVVIEAQYEDDGTLDCYDISVGDLADMKVSDADEEDGWVAKVAVIEADDQKAELVYIIRVIEPKNVAEIVTSASKSDLFSTETTKWAEVELTLTETLEAGAVVVVLYDAEGNVVAEAEKTSTTDGTFSFTFFEGEHESDNWTASHQMVEGLDAAVSYKVFVYDVEIG